MSHRLTRRTWAALGILLVAIPALMAVFVCVWDERKYYLTSLLLVGLMFVPFVLRFEGRRPQARELVLLATMTALAVAGRIINNFKFYAVFQENEEFTVRSESAELGTIVNPPPPGERIAIAGHCWIVEEVDWKRHTVFATQVKGRVPAYFGDCPGDINTHVLERMRKALTEHATYPYLMGNARARLAQARQTADISGAGTKPLINLGGDTWVLFPWLGSYAFLALERMLKIKCAAELGLRGLDPSRPYFMQFKMKADEETFFEVLSAEAEKDFDPIELVYPGEVPYFDRYDEYVPEELVRKGFAEGVLDIEGMKQRVLSWRDHT